MITGKTKTIGIMGWPVEHSMSPILHNTAFKELGLDYVYVPLPVNPDSVGEAVAGLKALGFAGANVTIPHKIAVMQYLDEIDRSAQLVGAVNTIVVRNGKTIGHNTDAEGFIQSLLSENIEIQSKHIVLIGAGGAAKAVIAGLTEHGASSITVGARSAIKADQLVQDFSVRSTAIDGYSWEDDDFSRALQQADIVVQCTPLGMSPHIEQQPPIDWDSIKADAVICDLIYNPKVTVFLRNAQQRGHQIINGEGMLIEQGALAFQLWTGVAAPRDTMKVAMFADK